jgi:hypothetical protein
MGQLIRLPVGRSQCSSKPLTTDHAPAKPKGKSAKVLMFIGVRYERSDMPPSRRLPETAARPELNRN